MRHFPALALEFQRKLASEVEALRVRLTEQAHLGARDRLIKLLLELGEKYGRNSNRGLVIDLELTEQEIAQMVGSSREWVSKQISALQRRGIILHGRGEIVILDDAGLQRLIAPPA